MRNTLAVILSVVALSAVAGPSVKTAAPKTPAPAPAPKVAAPASFKVRCSSCDENIEGNVTVDATGLSFCCTGLIKPGAKTAAKCPYSFKVPLADLSQQYLESAAPESTWHLVSGDSVHWAFASNDGDSIRSAYDWLHEVAPKIPSEPFQAKYAELLKSSTKAPALTAADACP